MLFVCCIGKEPQMKWKYWLCNRDATTRYVSSMRVNCHLNSLSENDAFTEYSLVLESIPTVNLFFIWPPPSKSSYSEMTSVSSKMNFLGHQSPKWAEWECLRIDACGPQAWQLLLINAFGEPLLLCQTDDGDMTLIAPPPPHTHTRVPPPSFFSSCFTHVPAHTFA